MKRSTENDKHTKDSSENRDPNTRPFEEFSKEDFPDTVLHFGKRSVYIPKDSGKQSEDPWLDKSKEKRLDYWDTPNTLHFGKKSDPWDNHYTVHFGKINPWDYPNTLYFGKKFDPWEGHHKMHFGKRSGSWDHSVMHFGKREGINNNLQTILNAEDILSTLLSDPEKLKRFLLDNYSQQGGNDIENKKLLESLENFDVHLRDENIPFEEKLNLLKSYLKPILKTILKDDSLEETEISNPYLYTKEYVDDDLNNNLLNEGGNFGDMLSRTIIDDKNFGDEILPQDSEDADDENYEENLRWIDYLKKFKDSLKSKRANLGKPELKRYFVPFQGPKSIVYPHAWFASQIRRSSLPRTADYAKNMQMRMAEKKEDPFNSYMHFGRR